MVLITVLDSRITKTRVATLHHAEVEISIRSFRKEGEGHSPIAVEDEVGGVSSITNLGLVIRITTVVVMKEDLDPEIAMIGEVTAVKMMIQ